MKFFATLDNWVVHDEFYKPFYKGQKTALAFKLTSFNDISEKENSVYLRHISNSSYEFSGKIVWPAFVDEFYNPESFMNMIVVDTGEIKFYLVNWKNKRNDFVGKYISGKAEIKVDDSVWSGLYFSGKNPSAPDIFTNVEINSIKVLNSEFYKKNTVVNEDMTFINLEVDPDSYSEKDLIEVEQLENIDSLGGLILLELKKTDEQMDVPLASNTSRFNDRNSLNY
jgi:hypothetical protein